MVRHCHSFSSLYSSSRLKQIHMLFQFTVLFQKSAPAVVVL